MQEELGETDGMARALNDLGLLAHQQDDYPRAAHYLSQAVELMRTTDNVAQLARMINNLGMVALEQKEYERALALYREALPLRRQLGDERGRAITLRHLGSVEYSRGQYEKAIPFYEESIAIFRQLTDRQNLALALHNLGLVLAAQGRHGQARTCYAESRALCRELGDNRGAERAEASLAALPPADESAGDSCQECPDHCLTPRELDVVRYVAQGLSDREVAARLHISPRTVGNHLQSVYDKLQLKGRAAVVSWAFRSGITPAE